MKQTEWSAVLEDERRIVLREFPIPEIGPDDALMKVEMVGVCGSDPKEYHRVFKHYKLPFILGHEVVGRIAEIGDMASRRWNVKKGDRIITEPNASCGQCYYCETGRPKWCRNRLGFFISSNQPPYIWGGYGEYMYMPAGSHVYKISDDLTPEAAVLINAVIANGIQWACIKGGASIGDMIVVQGTGAQGLAATIAAKESGASPIVVTGLSKDKERLALAKRFGADYTVNVEETDLVEFVSGLSGGMMADVVIDVTGSAATISKSVDLVKIEGTLVIGSLVGEATAIMTDKLARSQITIKGVYTNEKKSMLAAIKLVESRKYPVEEIITHKYPLQKAEEAVKAAGGDIPGLYPIKVAIVP